MKYALLIAAREYAEHVKTRGFILGLVFFPFVIFASFRAPALLERYATQTRYFAVIDPTGEYTKLVDDAVQKHNDQRQQTARKEWEAKKAKDASTPDFVPRAPHFVRVPVPESTLVANDEVATMSNLKPFLTGDRKIHTSDLAKDEELFALFVFPTKRAQLNSGVQYWSTNLTDDALPDVVTRAIQDDVRGHEYESAGVSRDDAARIARIDVTLETKDPRKAAGEEDVGLIEKVRQWTPVGFVYLMFVALVTVAQMLLSSTIEEKSSRIFEVLLSSVTSTELMFGKLVGVAAVALTMLSAWLLCLYIVLRYFIGDVGEYAPAVLQMVFTAHVLVPLVTYFLLGFLTYASLMLAFGSLCNTLKEAQNFMGPVMMLLTVPLLAMIFIAKDPNGTLARVLTWIPAYTPFIMMNRIAGKLAPWEFAGTIALMVATVVFMVWLAGRIFRNGVLRTGAPPKLVELFRLVRS